MFKKKRETERNWTILSFFYRESLYAVGLRDGKFWKSGVVFGILMLIKTERKIALAVFTKAKGTRNLLTIDVNRIVPNPSQPRKRFDEDELRGLADSIRKNGIIQPLTVRRLIDGSYELISGERRLRAAKAAGLQTVPCILMEVDDRKSAVISLLENLQREDLTFFEEAEAIQRLLQVWGITQQEAAEQLGKSQSAIANKLRLLRLTKEQRERIVRVRLTERHARALLRIADDHMRDQVLDEVIAKDLNVWETDDLVNRVTAPLEQKETAPRPIRHMKGCRDLRLFVNTINRAVETMRQSGLDAWSAKNETETHIEYRVFIPKTNPGNS